MEEVVKRFNTFKTWKFKCPNAKSMAFGGFIHVSDVSMCLHCHFVLPDYYFKDRERTHPHKLHATVMPTCKFIQTYKDPRIFEGFTQPKIGQPLYAQYELEANRFTTFCNDDDDDDDKWILYARAGFFNSSSIQVDATTDCTCFYCGVSVYITDAETNPWKLHAEQAPNCTYLRLHKGEQDIERIVSEYRLSQVYWAMSLPAIELLLKVPKTRKTVFQFLRMGCALPSPCSVDVFVDAVKDHDPYFLFPMKLTDASEDAEPFALK